MTDLLAFVDESARPGRYLMCSVLIEPGQAGTLRRRVRRLLLPGQSRLHFKKEGVRHRRELASALVEFGVDVSIVASPQRSDRRSRWAEKAANPAADRPDVNWAHFLRPWALGNDHCATGRRRLHRSSSLLGWVTARVVMQSSNAGRFGR